MKRFNNLSLLGLTFLLSPLGAVAQVAPADQGTINHRYINAVARRETARPVRLTVPPNGQAPITIATLPDAICSLHPEGDTSQSLKLFADEEGIVRFHAGGSEEANIATQFVLDCATDGVAQTFPLELRPNSVPTVDMPAPAEEVQKPKPGSFVRRALTEFEAAALSNEELAARGYLWRPDAKDSKAYATWLTTVTQPMTVVAPRQVVNPEITHGSMPRAATLTSNPAVLGLCCATSPYSTTRSGFQLQGPKNRSFSYALVTGTWIVPTASDIPPGTLVPLADGKRKIADMWVGLDGVNTCQTVPDLTLTCQLEGVKAGTLQEAIRTNGVLVYNDYAWTEFLPQDIGLKAVTSLSVYPGDTIICYVWIGDVVLPFFEIGPTGPVTGTDVNLSGKFAFFLITDIPGSEHLKHAPTSVMKTYFTSQSRTYFGDSTGAGDPGGAIGIANPGETQQVTTVPGYEAEWMIGRPTLPDGPSDLANYGNATMWGAHAQLNNSSMIVPANSSNSLSIQMVSGFDSLGHPAGNLLSFPAGAKTCPTPTTCTIVPDEVLFTWHSFK